VPVHTSLCSTATLGVPEARLYFAAAPAAPPQPNQSGSEPIKTRGECGGGGSVEKHKIDLTKLTRLFIRAFWVISIMFCSFRISIHM